MWNMQSGCFNVYTHFGTQVLCVYMGPTQDLGDTACNHCGFNLHCVYNMWCVVLCCRLWVGGVYARDGGDTGGMVDQLIPTSEILPKHLHITKCSDTNMQRICQRYNLPISRHLLWISNIFEALSHLHWTQNLSITIYSYDDEDDVWENSMICKSWHW